MNSHRPILERFVAGYLEEVSALSYRQLADYQSPPYASLACGAGGIAYALWRAGVSRADPAPLAAGRRWIDQALAARARKSAFAGREFTPAHARSSVYYGHAGLDLCDALVSHASGDARRARGAFSRFATAARAATRTGSPELLGGVAGFLSASSLLASHLPGPAPRRLEEELVRALASARRARLDLHGMAHGEAGVHFALLQASQRRRRRVSPRLRAELTRLADLGERAGRGMRWPVGGEQTLYHGGWCRGSSGFALLWAKAYEATDEDRFARLARRAALDAHASAIAVPDLCCGAVGSAYAMLALARIDPGRGWRRRAGELAMAALVSEVQTVWAHGLFKGEAGTVCLAMDLLSGDTRFPCLEV